jgi:hypothetical protein
MNIKSIGKTGFWRRKINLRTEQITSEEDYSKSEKISLYWHRLTP